MSKLAGEIFFPAPISVPLKSALGWSHEADWIDDVKEDGVRAELSDALCGRAEAYGLPSSLPASLDSCQLDGELMHRRVFVAFDLKVIHGQDITGEPLWFRRQALRDLVRSVNLPWLKLIQSGERLEKVLARGGEGIVRKRLSAPYGVDWFKAKRFETHDCIITEIHPVKSSIRLAQHAPDGTLVDRGWCPVADPNGLAWAKTRRIDVLTVGDVIEVGCQYITPRGKLREPRPMIDESGNLKVRRDKPAVECITV